MQIINCFPKIEFTRQATIKLAVFLKNVWVLISLKYAPFRPFFKNIFIQFREILSRLVSPLGFNVSSRKNPGLTSNSAPNYRWLKVNLLLIPKTINK